jgi:hypothetical protein
MKDAHSLIEASSADFRADSTPNREAVSVIDECCAEIARQRARHVRGSLIDYSRRGTGFLGERLWLLSPRRCAGRRRGILAQRPLADCRHSCVRRASFLIETQGHVDRGLASIVEYPALRPPGEGFDVGPTRLHIVDLEVRHSTQFPV